VRAPAGRKRFNVLGALNAITHEVITVTNDSYINAQSVCTLLRQLAALHVHLPLTLVLDNARYQKCSIVQELATLLHIELLYLPSYSPNLNLNELPRSKLRGIKPPLAYSHGPASLAGWMLVYLVYVLQQ
jgi:transposase